jgi:recombination protein U
MRIIDGFFETPSTLDYNGIYKGYYIEFDAKETKSKTSFSINNIHKHQIIHIKRVLHHNGIAFLIVRFTLLEKDYVLRGEDLIDYLNNSTKKSIPLSYFEENCYQVDIKYAPRLDYIKIVDKIIKEKCSIS